MVPIHADDPRHVVPGLRWLLERLSTEEGAACATLIRQYGIADDLLHGRRRVRPEHMDDGFAISSGVRRTSGGARIDKRFTPEQLDLVVRALDGGDHDPGVDHPDVRRTSVRYGRALTACRATFARFDDVRAALLAGLPESVRNLGATSGLWAEDALDVLIERSRRLSADAGRNGRSDGLSTRRAVAQAFCANEGIAIRYCFGDCYALALALRDATGLPVATCHASDQSYGEANGCHSFLLPDEGIALDIHGRHDLRVLLDDWSVPIRFGHLGEPTFSIASDPALYEDWTPYARVTGSDQHAYVARQVLLAYA